jgi:glycerol-3-phosphate dehydrogenase
MRRDLDKLAATEHDLIVVGAGVHGACAAWDAALRGLKVALVERDDFGGATSANSLKVLHGGFRYLQSLDLARLRLSARETATLLRVAPHLTRPLPCLLPLRAGLKENPLALSLALKAYGLLSAGGPAGPNAGLASPRALPSGRVLRRDELESWAPPELTRGAKAGALWYDGLAVDSERLTLAFVQSAVERGATAANYLAVTGLETAGGLVAGVRARDTDTGQEVLVRGKAVLLTAGAWNRPLDGEPAHPPELALAVNLVMTRELGKAAVAVRSRSGEDLDPVCGGGRFMFMVPWRGHTLLGTSYRLQAGPAGPAGQAGATAGDLLALLAEFNQACPELNLRPGEINFFHAGLLPLAKPGQAPAGGGLADRPRVLDHGAAGGPTGLISLSPVKFTTARALAQQAVDLVCRQVSGGWSACRTDQEPVWGADARPQAGRADQEFLAALAPEARAWLIQEYGSRAGEVAALAHEDAALARPLAPDTPVLGCQVAFAARREMARRLSDVTLRRTFLGKAGRPSAEALDAAAGIMARTLGWDQAGQRQEIAQANAAYDLVDQARAKGKQP